MRSTWKCATVITFGPPPILPSLVKIGSAVAPHVVWLVFFFLFSSSRPGQNAATDLDAKYAKMRGLAQGGALNFVGLEYTRCKFKGVLAATNGSNYNPRSSFRSSLLRPMSFLKTSCEGIFQDARWLQWVSEVTIVVWLSIMLVRDQQIDIIMTYSRWHVNFYDYLATFWVGSAHIIFFGKSLKHFSHK